MTSMTHNISISTNVDYISGRKTILIMKWDTQVF